MYRRKRKKGNIRLWVIVIALLGIVGIKTIDLNQEEQEVFKIVRESDLEKLMSLENTDDISDVKEEHKNGANQKIRVLIKGNGYRGEAHSKVKIASESKMCITSGKMEECVEKGETLVLESDDHRFKEGVVRITSDKKIEIQSLERAYGTPSYEGVMELWPTAEGIVIINELPVEKYLRMVVPSEMPASYELEALKAQAVCARSYAYQQMEKYGYPEYKAHINDSTDYQVYGNTKSQKETDRAVEETKGQVVYYRDEIATTYFYSTSCGRTTDIEAWGSEKSKKNAYLQAVKVKNKQGDYEKNLPWYKWKVQIQVETLSDLVGLNVGKDIGLIRGIEVTRRGGGGIVAAMKITGEKGSVTVETENKIRKVLGGKGYHIELNDGSMTDSRELLPSAFFSVDKSGDTFVITGGGFGHGIGMSQNGANEMAKQGSDYIEILELFYQDIEVR